MLVSLAGCASQALPPTPGETARQQGAYGYTPLDPLPVPVDPELVGNSLRLQALPDTTMRLAIGQIDDSGNVTYGPVAVGTAGNNYEVTLDYIQFTTKSFPVKIIQTTESTASGGTKNTKRAERVAKSDTKDTDFLIPVYVGVGLRLTAHVSVISGSVNLTNLAAIGAAVTAKQANGTLVIQSLGIGGESIASAIPIPSEINETTIQNALMAIGTIKAKTYDAKTNISPRVLAVYNPFPGSGAATINGFISSLLQNPNELELTLEDAANEPSPPATTESSR
jgi:hypothetical protein